MARMRCSAYFPTRPAISTLKASDSAKATEQRSPARFDIHTFIPRDTDDAARMLGMLSGREHVVTTAVAVARGKKLRSAIEEVRVRFRRLRDDEIESYVATGEPLNMAGGFTIEGLGGWFVDSIDGDHNNVIGISLPLLRGLLLDLDVTIPALWGQYSRLA